MWIDQELLQAVPETGAPKRGHPLVYTDAVIQMLFGLKQVFRFPLRALQGFAGSLRKLAFANLPVPHYSTVSRRAQIWMSYCPPCVLKLMSRCTWWSTARACRSSVRRNGRCANTAIPSAALGARSISRWTQRPAQVCAALMTHQDVGDGEVLSGGGDGTYDSKPCHTAIAARGAQPSLEGAKPWSERTPGAA